MKHLFLLTVLLSIFIQAKYHDNYSCKECHEKIYNEFQNSKHSSNYFTNELHRKIANQVSTKKYKCARCHMPGADNLEDLMSGKARPDKNNKTHTDAIGCMFCHTIAYVKKSHKFNINTKAKQAKNYKPTYYGRLDNPDMTDNHSCIKNPIYSKKVCLGCHSHKRNDNNTTIFRAIADDKQNSESCIECHMPEIAGGNESFNKKVRTIHASHKFLGIHDKEFRKTGVDLNVTTKDKNIIITIKNKMSHPLIIQPARVKYLIVELFRDNKSIWKNYKNNPNEDKKTFFEYRYKKDKKDVIIPADSTEHSSSNLEAKETKEFIYSPLFQKGDTISVSLYAKLAKSNCTKVIDLEDINLTKPMLVKKFTTKL